MPSMFSRRRGSSSQPPVSRSTSTAATTAASQAFLSNASSNGALSSAAAAAALRSHNTTPEQPGNLVTKRMVRRGSHSSVGSGSEAGSSVRGGLARAGLQRSNSAGSMTERTFRSPSPGAAPRTNGVVSPANDAPPVPPLPRGINNGVSKQSGIFEPRARVTSPTSSVRASISSPDREFTSAKRPTNLSETASELDGEEMQNTKSSVNFSRPRSALGGSPINTDTSPRPTRGRQGGWFTGPVGTAAASPTPKGKTNTSSNASTTPASRSRQSSAVPTSGATRAEDEEEMEIVTVYDPNTRTFVQRLSPKPKAEPASPVKATPPPLKPGSYNPATRSIVSKPGSAAHDLADAIMSDSEAVPSLARKKNRTSITPVNTTATHSPRSQSQSAPSTASPSSPRAAGFLHKQPSVVREDPIAEREAEALAPPSNNNTKPTNRMSSSTVQPSKAYVTSTPEHQRSVSLDVPRGAADRGGRGGSLSPSRSTRFSASPVLLDGRRHEPPQRGTSPVKSALKHSPSSSVRANSPITTFSSAAIAQGPGSDVSDSTSLASADGSASGGRKKKSARVSFEDDAQDNDGVGAAAAPKTLNAVAETSHYRGHHSEDDEEGGEFMKPRPALPSFGSVRRNRVQNDVAEKVTERPPDRQGVSFDQRIGSILVNKSSAQHNNEPLPPEVTSKESALGESDSSEDERINKNLAVANQNAASATPLESQPTSVVVDEKAAKDDDVPAISLQPPTPGIDEADKELATDDEVESTRPKSISLGDFVVPGGWQDEPVLNPSHQIETKPTPTTAPEVVPVSHLTPTPQEDVVANDSDDSGEFSDAAEDLTELEMGGFASLDAIVDSPVVTPSKITIPSAASAAGASESPRNLQGDSTADAESATDWTQTTSYWSKLSTQQRRQIEREHFSSDDEARPVVAKAQKPTPIAVTAQVAVTTPVAPAKLMGPSPNKQQPSTKSQAAPPQKSALKKSMRAQSPPEDNDVHMRRTMRGGPGAARPQSDYGPPRVQQPRNQPARNSYAPSAQNSSQRGAQTGPFPVLAGQKQQQHQPPPPPPPQAPKSKLTKQPQNDSDSESSFRKKRRPSTSTVDSQGRFNMRRSMRAGSVDSTQRPTSSAPSNATDSLVRSLSPSGSVFGRGKGDQLRESIRASPSDGGVRTMRGPKSMRNQPTARPAQKANVRSGPNIGSRFKSRFVDSDEEDEGDRGASRPVFRSRFVDSDDEDVIPEELTPVRGIPKRKGQEDGDSTDLEDESDDAGPNSKRKGKQRSGIVTDPAEVEKAMEIARQKLGIAKRETNGNAQHNGVKEGDALNKGSLRSRDVEQKVLLSPMSDSGNSADPLPEKKKRGFMSSILKRNKNSSQSVQRVGSPPPASPTVALPSTPQQATAAQPPQDATPSTPTPNKLVRRASDQARIKQGAVNTPPAASIVEQADSPSLAHKSSENWPLPPPIPEDTAAIGDIEADPERPKTSDSAARFSRMSMRPSPGRSFSGRVGFTDDVIAKAEHDDASQSQKDDDATVYSQRTGRKKKFGLLRRAFGLYD